MKLKREERGAVVVEFALVLPLLVLFVFGIVEFGRAYSTKIELAAAVREGVRTAALGGTTITAKEIEDTTKAAAPGLAGITVLSTKCTTSPSATATVTARYAFSYDIPLLRSRTADLQAVGVMRCGG